MHTILHAKFTLCINATVQDVLNSAFSPDQSVLNFYSAATPPPSVAGYANRLLGHHINVYGTSYNPVDVLRSVLGTMGASIVTLTTHGTIA